MNGRFDATTAHPGRSPLLSNNAAQVLLGNGAYGAVPGMGTWASFTTTRTGFTDVGAPTITSRYCQIGNVVFFQIRMVPSTTIASVAGTSYCSLPVTAGASALAGSAMMGNATTLVSIGDCVFDIANSRVYTPAQLATANTLVVSGNYEA